MPSLFDEIDSASQAAITSIFGDRIRIRPQAGDKNYGGSPDGSRVPVELDATFSSAPATVGTDYPSTARNGADAGLSPSEVWVDRANAAAVPYKVRRGDKIEVLNGPTVVSTFLVASVEQGDHGDLRIVLAR